MPYQSQKQIRQRRKKPEWQTRIASERIEILFKQAEKEFRKHPRRSRRYVELARKIGMRYNVRLGGEEKRKFCKFCKSCNTLLKPGATSQVRLDSRKKTKIIICLKCNKVYRYPYKSGRS
jgi:ribonuclease P protein subunit RPR2